MRVLALAALVVAASFAPGDRLARAAYPEFLFPLGPPVQGPSAWSPIDRAAERVFHEADENHDDFLSAAEVRRAQPMLRKRIGALVRRGVMRHIPPESLDGQASGIKLPGQEQTSKPEFVLFARSLALHMANPPIGVLAPAPGGPPRPMGFVRPGAGNPKTMRRPLDG